MAKTNSEGPSDVNAEPGQPGYMPELDSNVSTPSDREYKEAKARMERGDATDEDKQMVRVYEARTNEGKEDEPSPGNNSSPSDENKLKSSETNKPKFQKPARTTENRSPKG